MRSIAFISTVLLSMMAAISVYAQKTYTITSPANNISVTVKAGAKLEWQASLNGGMVIAPSIASLRLSGNEVLGENIKVASAKTVKVNSSFTANNYKKKTVIDNYTQLTLACKGDYAVIFRVYDDGVAYRFTTNRKKGITVTGEEANFNFAQDHKTFIPYVREPRKAGDQFLSSYEALYDERPLSGFFKDSLAFLPILVDLGNGAKVGLLDVGLENYPGMMLQKGTGDFSVKATFAKYPLKTIPGGYNFFNAIVTERADYIAMTKGINSFPWRAVIIAPDDKALLNNDMVQRLAEPSRLADVSWIRPGKVAWDWWNNWNISKVDFKAGVNTETYKYYIDFASANKLEYVILDEGWSDPVDLKKISPKIDLQEIIDYGKKKNVDIILWASWRGVDVDMEGSFAQYSKMGAKGFKIDFLDRDDQVMTNSTYLIAEKAAKYHLLVDLHGVYKPDGLQRTYPNVINYEGVRGLENAKWAVADDVPRYDVSIPFIRMLAGPLDYTPGAMRNAIKENFRAIGSNPMSQGTRCHQLAMYVAFEAPLQMLADNPTAYMKEQESTDFISKIPTTFDETVALDGKVAEYLAIARKKGDTWYVGAMSNWDGRDMNIDLSFLPAGNYEAEIFKDGVNADGEATDYKKEIIKVSAATKLKIHMANGGGWAARIYPVK
ncbi:MAG: glycoside hydrolase family 97 protein [Mucilaginibacter sp.]